MKKSIPFYKRKLPRSYYLDAGDPVPINEKDLITHKGWVPLSTVEMAMWEDYKGIVDRKNEKKDFLVNYYATPKKLPTGKFLRTIEVLHVNYRGFSYAATAPDQETLSKNFWPTVVWLIAFHMSPKVVVSTESIEPPIPKEKDESKNKYRSEAVARFMK